MTKTKSTKRALLLSALSLLMCVSMLVGSTFAWFTDSATSANNKIVAGTLDVELYMWNGTTYENISETSKPIFGEGSIAQNNNAETLWEPGKTQVAYLMIKNKGNLALNYTVGLNVQNVSKDLYKAMQYVITPDAQNGSVTSWDATNAKSVVLGTQTVTDAAVEMAPGAEHYFALSIHMDELAGNEYQGGEINFDLTVLANQAPVESDSFNNQYDANANVFNVTTTEEAQAALDAAEDGAVINLTEAVNYGTLVFRQNASSSIVDITSLGGDAAGNEKYRKIKNLTINGVDGAIVDGFTFPALEEGVYSYIDIENWTVNNVTFSAAQTPFVFAGPSELGIDGLTIVNCKMKGNSSEVRLVYQGLAGYTERYDKSSNEYVMTTGVKNLTITGCEVDGAHQVIETRQMENLTITNNTFKHIESRDMMIGAASGKGSYTGTITITGNHSIYGKNRFIRGTGIGDATLVIKDNVVDVYYGADTDYIKVDGATGAREVSGNIAANGLTVVVNP